MDEKKARKILLARAGRAHEVAGGLLKIAARRGSIYPAEHAVLALGHFAPTPEDFEDDEMLSVFGAAAMGEWLDRLAHSIWNERSSASHAFMTDPLGWLAETINVTARLVLERVSALSGAPPPPNGTAKKAEPPPPPVTTKAAALADELGVDLAAVEGTGKDGRVTLADVKQAAEPPKEEPKPKPPDPPKKAAPVNLNQVEAEEKAEKLF